MTNEMNQTTTEPPTARTHRISRLTVVGHIKTVTKAAVLAGSLLVIGRATVRAQTSGAAPRGSTPVTAADIDHIDRGYAKETAMPAPTTYTAPATDSLRLAILEGSSVTLAPGSTLIISPRLKAPSGVPVWHATVNGSAHFTIAGPTKTLVIHAATGRTALGIGTYDVRMSSTALVVRTLSGTDALLYKKSGWKSIVAHHIHAGAVAGWERETQE